MGIFVTITIMLMYIIKWGLIFLAFYLIVLAPTDFKILRIKFYQRRNDWILKMLLAYRGRYISKYFHSDNPKKRRKAWLYWSTNAYWWYEVSVPYIVRHGGGNCIYCHTLTYPDMRCPKCGAILVEGYTEYYHKDVRDYLERLKKAHERLQYEGLEGWIQKQKDRLAKIKERGMARRKHKQQSYEQAIRSVIYGINPDSVHSPQSSTSSKEALPQADTNTLQSK